ncbi:DUF3857 domain-containing protein [Abyssalbus ytuae]|uniref:DUF3857 and transglutaminase domain-containing protein n=1 Tax=Abyssalbus ytuae TaxID=2926907 RepID=A0A9E7A2V6_9FLAO|nr:DUF3857 and transglutaminase domain-containing protein [Abyssalbus ytuae]UOB18831.1 DUF3857 and transglutaminase domain-containing protein [Abyssalbus ytuae]
MRRILLVLIIMTFNCLHNNLLSQNNNKLQLLLIDEKLIDNSNAVLKLDSMTVEIKSQRSMSIKYKRIITVLNESGNKYVHAFVGYDKSISVKYAQAIVYDSAGRQIKKFKQKDFKDRSAYDGFSLFSDNRVLYLEYSPITYPYTVEFSYETQTPNTAAIPSWYFLGSYEVSVEKSHFKVLYDQNEFHLRTKEKNFDGFNITQNNSEGIIYYYAQNLPAIKREDLSPSFIEFTPTVGVASDKFHLEGVDGTATDWNSFGKWMYNQILAGRRDLPIETVNEIKGLTSGIEDPLEKAKKVYEYVQKNTRYISVQVGIGGYQPIPAAEVDKVKYGDCKGLSNYTQALLETVGVKSYYTHVEAGNEIISFEEDFASLSQGNHVILCIPHNDELYWIDCTTQIHPFGFIGDFTDDRRVLIMKPEGGEIVKTVSYTNEDNYQKNTGNYKIDNQGNLTGNIKIVTNGIQYDNRFAIENKSEEDNIKRYKEYFSNINNLSIDDFSFNNDKNKVEFTENVNLSAGNYASVAGNRFIFVVNVFNKNSFVPERCRNRNLPLKIKRGYLDEDEVLISLPQDFSIEALPDNETINNKFGEYSVSFTKNDDGTVIYKRRMFIKEGLYPKEDYKLYREFRNSIKHLDNSKMVIIKS